MLLIGTAKNFRVDVSAAYVQLQVCTLCQDVGIYFLDACYIYIRFGLNISIVIYLTNSTYMPYYSIRGLHKGVQTANLGNT